MFEFDPEKSRSNLEKHGIDFVEAQELWKDDCKIVFPVSSEPEPRFLMVASYNGKYWTAIYTHRGDNIRIISVRRSRTREIDHYEN